MSERGQIILVWWGLIFMYIFGFCIWMMGFMPPPTPMLDAEQVAAFYRNNNFDIRIGAMITSWTSAFAVPITIAATCQLLRVEKGTTPVWSITTLISGGLMSMFLVFPPLVWGVAAFSAERNPELTLILHELGTLTLTTTDQFYIFGMIAIAAVSFQFKDPGDGSWPFPRWFGYFTLWAAVAFEVGAFAFMTKKGAFAWNGAMVYWMPLVVYGSWITVISVMMLRSLHVQLRMAKAAA